MKRPNKNTKKIIKKIDKNGSLKAKANSGSGYAGSGIFSAFEGAKFSNKRQWINTPYATDFKKLMSVYDRQELTRKMRYLELNSGVVRQMVSDNALHSVGSTGLKPQPASGDPAWDKLAYEYFREWASRPCEITGRYNFAEMQIIVSRKIDIDGEIFALKTYNTNGTPLIQLIESHRIGTSNWKDSKTDGLYDGILFNKFGTVVGYSVVKSDGDTRIVPANQMLHVHHPENVTGARAYSPLQHSINSLVDNLEMLSLEIEAVKANGDIVRTITKESGQFSGDIADFEAFGMKPQDYPNQVYQNPNEVGSFIGGKILALAPGEKLESHTSTRANENFQTFIDLMNRNAVGGVLPYEFCIDPSKAGGASIRLITAKAQRMFDARQQVIIDKFGNPIWAYVIAYAIHNGDLPPNDNFHKVNWVTPRKITVDAGRDAMANQRDIQMGLKTLSDHYAEQGMDFHEETEKRIEEQTYITNRCKEKGLEPWRLFMPLNTPIPDIDGETEKPEASSEEFKPLS